MKIAMLGLRSIGPTALGGIEKVVEELSTRYVAAGHEVTVFVRARYAKDLGESYKGVRIKPLPAIYTKHLEAITNTVAAILSTLRGFDIIHINALGPALLSFVPRMFGQNVVVTVHGQDWKREKWGGLAKLVLRVGEWAAVTFPKKTVVVSKTLKNYEKERFDKEVVHIPNGVIFPDTSVKKGSDELGLERDDFILFMSRLVPEKGCHHLIEAFKKVNTSKKLVIAGAAPHSEDYSDQLKHIASGDERIIFTGAIYEEKKEEAFRNSYFFVLPSSIEGMAIVLLEAMGYGKCCLCSDIDENLEVIFPAISSEEARNVNDQLVASEGATTIEDMFGACFRTGDVESLARLLDFLIRHPEIVERLGEKARDHAVKRYNWDTIARQYLSVYEDMLAPRGARAEPPKV